MGRSLLNFKRYQGLKIRGIDQSSSKKTKRWQQKF